MEHDEQERARTPAITIPNLSVSAPAAVSPPSPNSFPRPSTPKSAGLKMQIIEY